MAATVRSVSSFLMYPCGFETIVISKDPDKVVLRLNCKTKMEFTTWLKTYEQKSKLTFRVKKGLLAGGKYIVHKAVHRCQHNTHPKSGSKPHEKHTNCPVEIKVTIKAVVKNSRSTDKYLPDRPTIVKIFGSHNHGVNDAVALKHRDPREDVKVKFLELFNSGHNPSQSLELYKKDLMDQNDDYSLVADRSICPDKQWVYRLYYKHFKKESGNMNGASVVNVKDSAVGTNTLQMDCTNDEKFCWIDTGNTDITGELFDAPGYQNPKNGTCIIKELNVSEHLIVNNDNASLSPVLQHDVHSDSVNGNSTTQCSLSEQAMLEDLEIKLQEIVRDIMCKSKANPSKYHSAVTAFHRSYMSLTTESAMLTALHCYGKNA